MEPQPPLGGFNLPLNAPLTASFSDKPCELHKYHWPPVLETEGHHDLPVYLQNRVYGRITVPDLTWVCDTGHKNVHAWIYFLLGERKHSPARRGTRSEMALAMKAVEWYKSERRT